MCQAVPVEIGKSKVLLIDTPGFDDTTRTDSDVLTEITKMLSAQYELGVSLKGVIYLHRITDVRYQGSSVKTLNIFKKICGDKALKNVILATTRWNEEDAIQGANRENQLRTDFWAYMLNHDSVMTRYYGDRDSAIAMASQLISRRSIVLDIQREMFDEQKTLEQTNAGAFVSDGLSAVKAKHEEEIRELENLRETLREGDRVMRRQIQQDWDREKARLQKIEVDQERLRRNVANEVGEKIHRKQKKRPSALKIAASLLPSVLGLLGMFVGIPPGTFNLLASWFSDSDIGDSVAEFFSSF